MNLKKMIAISVVFAVIAGAAFAIEFGGEVVGATVIAGASDGGDAELFNGGMGDMQITGTGETDVGVGTIGGWIKFKVGGVTTNLAAQPWESPTGIFTTVDANAWWQPIDALKIMIGGNAGDGFFDTSHIGRYGFYARANTLGTLVNSAGNWDKDGTTYDDAIYGGDGSDAFRLFITPIDALSFNVFIPLNAGEPADTFKNALFQANYAADGIGNFHLTYEGLGGGDQSGKIYVSAFLSMVENLGLELGVGFGLADEGAKKPLGIGLGVTYGAGAFGVKLRTVAAIPMEDEEKLGLGLDVLPYYAINDNVTAFADIGIKLTGEDDQFAWHLAPYIRIGSEWGTGFYAGLNINNGSGVKDADINWGIPFGMYVSF